MTESFNIKGMHCASCAAIIEKTLNGLEGVESAEVALLTNSASVVFDESKLGSKQIIKAVKAAGFEASVKKK